MFEWIPLSKIKPEVFEKVLFYKCMLMGGYYEGCYIGHYQQIGKNSFAIVIDDRETNRNNMRLLKEFSHWMPLPSKPEEDNV